MKLSGVLNVKVERGSTFTRDLSYMTFIILTSVNF